MLMTVLMEDALGKLPDGDKELAARGVLANLLYADDTLLLGVEGKSVQRYLEAIVKVGAAYGLELHWGKLQLINARCNACLRRPDGTAISAQEELTYLGSVISNDGKVHKQLARRLGMAQGTFRELLRVWKNSTLGRKRKLHLFNALIVPKLLYALQATWLSKAERRRLDGFQNRCLRVIWGIKLAYTSRVSNAAVLQATGEKPLTSSLERQQLLLFGKAARLPADTLLRQATFSPGSLSPAADRYIRKVGRPRAEWTTEVRKLAVQIAGDSLNETIKRVTDWKTLVEVRYNSL
jgi:hypothetical protein